MADKIRQLIEALEHEWRDALCSRDMGILRARSSGFRADRHALDRRIRDAPRRMARRHPARDVKDIELDVHDAATWTR